MEEIVADVLIRLPYSVQNATTAFLHFTMNSTTADSRMTPACDSSTSVDTLAANALIDLSAATGTSQPNSAIHNEVGNLLLFPF